MIRQQPVRQGIRKGVILTTLLLFPIIMNYFSPYVITDGASQGVVNGSFIVFGVMFLSALLWLTSVWLSCLQPEKSPIVAGVVGRLVNDDNIYRAVFVYAFIGIMIEQRDMTAIVVSAACSALTVAVMISATWGRRRRLAASL